jgi:hypothetical protein
VEKNFAKHSVALGFAEVRQQENQTQVMKNKLYWTSAFYCLTVVLQGCNKPEKQNDQARIVSESVSNQLIIDTSIINDLSRLSDTHTCFESYPEILYLVQKDYPDAAYTAFKAAYILANSDGNFSLEVDNLVLAAFYATSDNLSVWNKLNEDEKKKLFDRLDDLRPVDWDTEKHLYK